MMTFTPRRKLLFSKFLQDRLAELNMTPEYLARAIGLRSCRRVRAWMAGSALPPKTRLEAIAWLLEADPLDVTLLWLGVPLTTPRS